MKLPIVITTFCISLFLYLKPSASLQFQMQSSQEERHDVQLSPTTLPRKRGFTEGVTVIGYEGQESSLSYQERKKQNSGKPNKRSTMKSSKETWQEWEEGMTESSQLFTMDYSRVRRRRPIHNKALPLGP